MFPTFRGGGLNQKWEISHLFFAFFLDPFPYLIYNGSDDDEERISQVKKKPELDRFDVRCTGEAGGH